MSVVERAAGSKVDVLVVGGGPAGLLAASYLSKEHRVALIERAKLGNTTKCWVTTVRRLEKHGLQDCAFARPRTMSASTFLGARVVVEGDFAVVDDSKLLTTLADRCRDSGVLLVEQCRLLNLKWSQGRVEAETTKDSFSARLVVDSTGGASPIASSFRLHHIEGFYSVYGAHLQGIELKTDEIVLGHVHQLGDPPIVLEVFPTSENSAYCVVFIYSKALVDPNKLAASFEDQCHNNPFFCVNSNTTRHAEKAGAIPIGRRGRRKLTGVVPFGEAGLIQPPLMGTAFNEVLEYAESSCEQFSQSLKRQRSGVRLRLSYPLIKRMQDRVQLPLIRSLLDGNIEKFDTVLRVMSRFPRELLFRFFSNELSWAEAIYIAAFMPWHFLSDSMERTIISAR